MLSAGLELAVVSMTLPTGHAANFTPRIERRITVLA
jgi:hypothetical protein